MAKLGTEKNPIVVRVNNDETASYVAETCSDCGWHYIIGLEYDKPEDISDLEKMLNPKVPIATNKISRNEPCPCGSEKKYKKCCGANIALTT